MVAVKWQSSGAARGAAGGGRGVHAVVLKVAEWTEAGNMVEAALKEPGWREAETTAGGVCREQPIDPR